MKAAWYETNGEAADVLRIGEIDKLSPGPEQVLVRIQATGIIPADTIARASQPVPAEAK